jgi:undecaprenyl-phosphate 4-deoxy-4-formamido-L-arabinose transferase
MKYGTISVVIPVYNGAETITLLVDQLGNLLPEVATEYEVILVNDGSRDESWESICKLSRDYNWVRGINLMRNYGQHNALLAGINTVSYEITITMDDDLQHPPTEIPKLLAKLAEGYDVVYGTPQVEQHGLWRNIASQVTKIALQSTMGTDVARSTSAFRVFRSQVRKAFINYQGPFVDIDVLLTWATTRFFAVRVRHESRHSGKSNYTFRKLVLHAINMITGFSTLPLQMASLVGFSFTLFGFCVLIYVVVRFLFDGGSVAGFPFLASIIAIFSGAQLFSLGIIGEYLARMHFRSMGRPASIVKALTDDSKSLT